MKFKKKKKKKKKNVDYQNLAIDSVAGQLSDRPKFFAEQNENLLVLSDSPAVFAKTGRTRIKRAISKFCLL